jgi:hypothetical protein
MIKKYLKVQVNGKFKCGMLAINNDLAEKIKTLKKG